jgi:hypothetical protein
MDCERRKVARGCRVKGNLCFEIVLTTSRRGRARRGPTLSLSRKLAHSFPTRHQHIWCPPRTPLTMSGVFSHIVSEVMKYGPKVRCVGCGRPLLPPPQTQRYYFFSFVHSLFFLPPLLHSLLAAGARRRLSRQRDSQLRHGSHDVPRAEHAADFQQARHNF